MSDRIHRHISDGMGFASHPEDVRSGSQELQSRRLQFPLGVFVGGNRRPGRAHPVSFSVHLGHQTHKTSTGTAVRVHFA